MEKGNDVKPWQEARMRQEMWDTVLLWSGYDRYYSIAEIAMALGVKKSTVIARINRFAKRYPQSYNKILSDRQAIKATTIRIDRALDHPVSFKSNMEDAIKEVF